MIKFVNVMRKPLLLYFIFAIFVANGIAQTPKLDLVNPFIGTGGHGHTFPGATVPYGMVQLKSRHAVEWLGCLFWLSRI